MSQRRNRSHNATQASQSYVLDNDDENFSKSQISGLSTEEENQIVGSVIRYLLAADRNKVAIHRQNLIKNVFNNHAKHYRKIMIIVKETLMEVMRNDKKKTVYVFMFLHQTLCYLFFFRYSE